MSVKCDGDTVLRDASALSSFIHETFIKFWLSAISPQVLEMWAMGGAEEATEAIVKIPAIIVFSEAGTLSGTAWVLAHDLEVTLFLYPSIFPAGLCLTVAFAPYGGSRGNARFNIIGTQHWLVH